MFGAGMNVIRQLLPGTVLLHCDDNPGFHGQAPEPLDKNLQELANTLRHTPELKIGLATDGDADRQESEPASGLDDQQDARSQRGRHQIPQPQCEQRLAAHIQIVHKTNAAQVGMQR